MSKINLTSRYETRRGDETRVESISDCGVRGYIYNLRTCEWERRTWSADGVDLELREMSLVEVRSPSAPLAPSHVMELI